MTIKAMYTCPICKKDICSADYPYFPETEELLKKHMDKHDIPKSMVKLRKALGHLK